MTRQFIAELEPGEMKEGVLELTGRDSLPPDDGVLRPPWPNRWEFERDGKRFRVAVLIQHDGHECVGLIDAREFIERLGTSTLHEVFEILVEEVK